MEDLVLVAGGGTMGAGIAFVAARGGYAVEAVEPDAAARQRANERVVREAQRAGDPSIAQRIRWSATIPSKSEASIAIEAVPERFDLKRDTFVAMAGALASDALIATNTSSLSVADAVPNPQRVVGLHFFNPPAAMKLVEIVHAPETSDEAIERGYAFVERIGKTAVLAADTPGFIVNRVARPFYLQSLRALERNLASAEELDALARAAGFRMGPFELMDFIGLDVNLATSESIYERTGAARLIPVELQRTMVAQGRLGRKSGAGFYDYSGEAPRLDLAVELPADSPNEDEMVALIGRGGVADELTELLEQRYRHLQRIENDELLDEIDAGATMVIDVGDGTTDRGDVLAELDGMLGAETVFFADAYATDIAACAARLRHPGRLVGYGVLGSLAAQRAVEIADNDAVSDDALELAQELFASIGKGVMLVEDSPALFLGRVVGSIVNEAVTAVHEDVATADDIDTAMRLGTNYPVGPIAWGREIGGARVTRILQRLAQAEGAAFAPHRSLWVLDVEEETNGALATVRPDDLAAAVVRALVDRTNVPPERIDDVFFGAANQSGEDNRNVARMAVLLAGLPVEVPGATVNRLCGSSLQALNSAAQAIAFGEGDVMIAGGVESMTRAPYVLSKSETPFGRKQELFDTVLGWRMANSKMPREWTISLGETAEKVAQRYGISRDAQDRFAYESQMKCKAAVERGAFDDEIVALKELAADEHPRPETTLEALAKLKPAFKDGGTVTAGNSSGINDGASAVLLCEAEAARHFGWRPLARVAACASAGVAPDVMGLGPIPATRKALRAAGIDAASLDLIEINEAFAAQALACINDLELDPALTNANGGAIALGHPLGASGARIATTLLHELRRRDGRYGLATMCIGVGQGIATIFERV
jgi:3-oxoadipyl-CoA thiolase